MESIQTSIRRAKTLDYDVVPFGSFGCNVFFRFKNDKDDREAIYMKLDADNCILIASNRVSICRVLKTDMCVRIKGVRMKVHVYGV